MGSNFELSGGGGFRNMIFFFLGGGGGGWGYDDTVGDIAKLDYFWELFLNLRFRY